MASKLKIINFNSENLQSTEILKSKSRSIRPSDFLNSVDLVPLNYYAPIKLKGNRLTNQPYNLQRRPIGSLDPQNEVYLPKIEDRFHRIEYCSTLEKQSKNESLYSQIIEMNSDENRRIKTEIDEYNGKIHKLLKPKDKKVQMVSILEIIGRNNRKGEMLLEENENKVKRKINRQLTNGRLLKYDP